MSTNKGGNIQKGISEKTTEKNANNSTILPTIL